MDKALRLIDEYKMLEGCKNVVIGVSGGADSVSLLLLICSLKDRYGIRPVAVHVNHGIRGAAADQDERFVEELCKKLGVICNVYHVNVPEYKKLNSLSEEEAGRKLRYQAFAKSLSEYPGVLALAHNSDDQVETVMFNMLRGSYLTGLTGMRALSSHQIEGKEVTVIRPLLNMTRKEIEAYLSRMQQAYVTDGTNNEDIYSRNIIRHKLLPVMEEVSEGARGHILRLADECEEIAMFLREESQAAYEKVKTVDGRGLDIEKLTKLKPLIIRQIIYDFIINHAGAAKDIGKTHVLEVMKLLDAEGGKYIMLPYGLKIKKEYNTLKVEKINEESCAVGHDLSFEINVKIGNETICSYTSGGECEDVVYHKCFFMADGVLDHMGEFELRKLRDQDFIVVLKDGGSKKVRKLMKDKKFESKMIEKAHVLAAGDRCLAVLAYGENGAFVRVDEAAKNIDNKGNCLEIIIKDKP